MDPAPDVTSPPLTGEVLPPQAPPRPPDNSLAVVSLVLGIAAACMALASPLVSLLCCAAVPAAIVAVGLGVGGIVCGHTALARIGRSGGREGGRGMAIAGLVTAYAAVALSALMMLLTLVGIGVFLLMGTLEG